MANMKKYTRGAIGNIFRHIDRQQNEKGEYPKFGNQDIDLERTHQNYNLHSGTSRSNYEKRMSEVKCMNRSDINVVCSWCVTMPKDLDPSKESEFFESTYNFLCERYGVQNVVSANVHKDENTPHLHFAFMPVITDKNGVEKLCAKKVCCRTDLMSFHTDLKRRLEKDLGCEVNVLNDATIDGNKTKKELVYQEVQQAEQQRDRAIDDYLDLDKLNSKLEKRIGKGKVDKHGNVKVSKSAYDMLCNAYTDAQELISREEQLRVRESIVERSKGIVERADEVSALERSLKKREQSLDAEVETRAKEIAKGMKNTELKQTQEKLEVALGLMTDEQIDEYSRKTLKNRAKSVGLGR